MEYIYDVWLSNLNAVVNNGGFISIEPQSNWCVDKHRFKQNKFYFITKGSCFINIDGADYTAKAGDWFFIPANTPHSYRNNNLTGFEKYWIHFDLYPQETDLFKLLNLPHLVSAKGDKKTLALFKKYAGTKGTSVTDSLDIKACLLQLISRYITLAGSQQIEIKNKSDERIDGILNYINENLNKDLSNDVLSKMCYLHPNHFIRFFKSKTNQTPASYIRQRRMEKAKRLLENTDYSISEIAHIVGADDEGYFSKQFKMMYSMSPREWRKYYKFHLQSAEGQIENKRF